MPRVKGLTNMQKIEQQKLILAEKCKLLLFEKKIKRKDVAEVAGISPQALGYQLNTGNITLPVLMTLIALTDVDAENIKKMLTIGDLK